MYKVFVIAALVILARARPQQGHGGDHKHGYAFSSQSIVLHQNHGHEQQRHGHGQQHHSHVQKHHGHEQQDYEHHHEDYCAHPKYKFEYKVQDPHTGDYKHQHESFDGDVVKGVYSLHEADGTVRIVEYNADKDSGFNTLVRHKGHAKRFVPQKHHRHHNYHHHHHH